MKFSTKYLFATLSMLTVLTVTPATAVASDSVYIDTPSLSVGFHGGHHSNRRHSSKKYKSRSNNYYDGRRYEKRQYRQKRNNNYNKRRYNDNNYYSGGKRNNQRYDRSYNNNYRNNNYQNNNYRNDKYRREACPIDGYSSSYDSNRNCYEHKGHYHCS